MLRRRAAGLVLLWRLMNSSPEKLLSRFWSAPPHAIDGVAFDSYIGSGASGAVFTASFEDKGAGFRGCEHFASPLMFESGHDYVMGMDYDILLLTLLAILRGGSLIETRFADADEHFQISS